MDDEFVLEQSLNGLEGLSSSEIADSGDEFPGDILVVSHAYFDGGEDPEFFLGDEVQVLSGKGVTAGSSFIVVILVALYLVSLISSLFL